MNKPPAPEKWKTWKTNTKNGSFKATNCHISRVASEFALFPKFYESIEFSVSECVGIFKKNWAKLGEYKQPRIRLFRGNAVLGGYIPPRIINPYLELFKLLLYILFIIIIQ